MVGVVDSVLLVASFGRRILVWNMPLSTIGRDTGLMLRVVILFMCAMVARTMLSRLVQRDSLLLSRLSWVKCVRRVILLWETVGTVLSSWRRTE